jgi:hypothetical protein
MRDFQPLAEGFDPALLAADRTALARDGFLILKEVLAPAATARLARELDPWIERTPRCVGDFYGWRTTRVGALLSKVAAIRDLVVHPRILALAEDVLKDGCDGVQLNLTQATRVHPGERAQAPHRDEEMWPAQTGGRPWLVNVMWSVSEFTRDNGATRLWPGSHRTALDRSVDSGDAIAAVMPAGSACIFLGALTHGAGANVTGAARTGVIVSYCLGWLKTYENQFLAYPRDVARAFPSQLQKLIGYRMHRPNLGGWEGQDPARWLADAQAPQPHVDALPPAVARELAAHHAAAAAREAGDPASGHGGPG